MSEVVCIHELDPAHCTICNGRDIRQRRKRAPMAERYADAIFDHIPAEDGGWIAQGDLAELVELSGAQVAAGVAYLRDNYPELPLVSSTQGYCFTCDEATVNRYRQARMRSALTAVRRLWRGTIKPYVDKTRRVSKREREIITKQFERLIEDLDGMA